MGRAKFFRQKLISHVDSVAVKTVYSWLLHQTRERFGVAAGKAGLVAQKGYLLLTRSLVKRSEEQIVFPALLGEKYTESDRPRNSPGGRWYSHPGVTTTWRYTANSA
ncbi:hypothetical protein J2Z49_000986 [Desulfofundulus luciae]|uniref:Uncharacterized protein n=1 Tax=Desulfofundulus luciae TaxID=74702 RepID=A0ABU0AZJ3_9FIRM|nr:hypothetical protein [Desulfofundulus luciae]MDQ0285881.1 hypothetical protein [Desulfofundulus luciae]